MTKTMKWVVGIIISIAVCLLCFVIFLSYVRSNVRTYGLYYASQYYGKNDYYNLLVQDMYTNKNPKEIRQKKGLFSLSNPDQNKNIYFIDKENYLGTPAVEDNGISIDGYDGITVYVTRLPYSDLSYKLEKDNKLHYTDESKTDLDKVPKNLKKAQQSDNELYQEKVGQYLDIQLKAIGKPKINLQKLYNWSQS